MKNKLEAVIFDMNGTVLADEDEYALAFRKVLKRLGKNTDKKYPQVKGIGVAENWELMLNKYNLKTNKTADVLASETQNEYLKRIGKITPRAGFIDFVEKLRNENIKTALATSNTWWIADKILGELGLTKYFDVMTTKEEITFNKPAPDIFLKTAEKLEVDPHECVVFEDSEAGIDAATEAEMKTVGILSKGQDHEELKNANIVIKNFSGINIERIRNLL